MGLRGVKPELVQKRLKALFYGMAGVGKTTAAIQFPKCYLIDTEKGAEHSQYVSLIQQSGGVVFKTCEFDDLITEITALITEKHDFKTLIIDPLTTLYDDLVNKSALLLKSQAKDKDATGTEFGRHYAEAAKKMKHLCNLLLRLDMNVIITSHAKAVYGDNMVVLGNTFDCYKKLDYMFDLVFEIQKRGKKPVGLVKKSRIEKFVDGESFPFSYDEIAERYGREILERDAVAQKLAEKEQVTEIIRLIDLLKVPEETWLKWRDKSNSEKWEEMPFDAIQKCIEYLNKKVKGETE